VPTAPTQTQLRGISAMNVTNTKNHRLFKMYVLLGALFCAFPMTTEKAFSEVPRGVFCLQPVGQGTGSDPIVYSDPDVDGISVWLAKKTAMITALGARYSNNPAVKIVGASFANAQSEDWGVPHLPAQVTAWLAAGYTSAKMLDTGRQIIDATMVAFPNQYVTL